MLKAKAALPDGVYLDLPEDDYFEQGCLGSTDLTRLWKFREGWWWQSRHNPRAPQTATAAQTFGRALHCRMLEGPRAFCDRFAVAPDPATFGPELLRTSEEILEALSVAGAPKPSTKARKADLVEMAKLYVPGAKIWDSIIEAFKAAAGEREVIDADEAQDIELMCDLAGEEPNLQAVMDADAGASLTEVSVFWTLPGGTRLRYRFDKLLPDGNVDLKTVGDARGDFTEAVASRIKGDSLEIQMAMSFLARHAAYQAIEEKRVYGGDRAARAWLRRFPKEAPLDPGDHTIPGWAWLWVFYQRPDSRGGRAPMILPVRELYGSPVHLEGFRKVQTALQRYHQAVERHGLDRPWTRVLPVHDLQGKLKNHLILPPWGEQPMPVAGEELAMNWRRM